ncbi:MAG: DUF4367 domain-containing protein [Oscillospiraceae bacterium]|nr:DUF4367 domain-containing protein [Oscillospiraceae bacterium]
MLGRSNQHPYGLNRNQSEQLSTEELEELLRLDFDAPENNALSTDDILRILDVIEKRECSDQVENAAEVERAWESFQKDYMPTAGDEDSLHEEDAAGEIPREDRPAVPHRSPRHRIFRTSLIAAIIVLLSLMFAAQAVGINLFKLIGTWTEETFHLTNSTEVMENGEPAASVNGSTNMDAKIQYASLSDALEDNGISADTIPTWWPAGYSLSQLSVSQMQNTTIIYSLYENEDESYTFSVRMLTAQENDPTIYEKDENTVIQYKKGGVIHYIISNINTAQAIWTDDSTIYTISGVFVK